jgi:transcriptional regulator of acetoin/glycerol metabolism
MQKAVDEAKGNKSKAAARLGIDRNHVHSYLKRTKGLI